MIWYFVGAAGLLLIASEANVTSGPFDDLFKKYGTKYDVNWKVLKAISVIESSEGKNSRVKRGLEMPSDVQGSVSSDGKSWGLMQVTIPTARDYDRTATPEKLNNAEYSVDIAARHIKFLKNLFAEQDPRYLEYVVKSYNQGQGATAAGKNYADGYWKKFQSVYGSFT